MGASKSEPLPELPEAQFVSRDNGYVSAYFTLGPKTGQPVVLCHGLAANGLQFVEDAHFLAAQGFFVIVPDLRGHGRSTCPPKRQEVDFSLDHLSADLIAILDAENITCVDWVGNSLGGILALYLMGEHADRLNRVITFGTSYSLSVPKIALSMMRWGYRFFGTKFFAQLGAPSTSAYAPARRIIFAMLNQVDPIAVAHTASHLTDYDLIDNALGFERPILLIKADGDHPVNAALGPTLAVLQKRPNFKLVDVAKAGHCANLDQPEKMRDFILTFLETDD